MPSRTVIMASPATNGDERRFAAVLSSTGLLSDLVSVVTAYDAPVFRIRDNSGYRIDEETLTCTQVEGNPMVVMDPGVRAGQRVWWRLRLDTVTVGNMTPGLTWKRHWVSTSLQPAHTISVWNNILYASEAVNSKHKDTLWRSGDSIIFQLDRCAHTLNMYIERTVRETAVLPSLALWLQRLAALCVHNHLATLWLVITASCCWARGFPAKDDRPTGGVVLWPNLTRSNTSWTSQQRTCCSASRTFPPGDRSTPAWPSTTTLVTRSRSRPPATAALRPSSWRPTGQRRACRTESSSTP